VDVPHPARIDDPRLVEIATHVRGFIDRNARISGGRGVT
jgi:hypothetical protein